MQKVRLRDLHGTEAQNPWENAWAGIKQTPCDIFLTLTFKFMHFTDPLCQMMHLLLDNLFFFTYIYMYKGGV